MVRKLPWKTDAESKESRKRATKKPEPKMKKETPSLSNSSFEGGAKMLTNDENIKIKEEPEPEPEEQDLYMIPGFDEDDQYMMVEDELQRVAGEITKNLHAAEYDRIRQALAIKNENEKKCKVNRLKTALESDVIHDGSDTEEDDEREIIKQVQEAKKLQQEEVKKERLRATPLRISTNISMSLDDEEEAVRKLLKKEGAKPERIPTRNGALASLLTGRRKEQVDKFIRKDRARFEDRLVGLKGTRASAGFATQAGNPKKPKGSANDKLTATEEGRRKRGSEGDGHNDGKTKKIKVETQTTTTPTAQEWTPKKQATTLQTSPRHPLSQISPATSTRLPKMENLSKESSASKVQKSAHSRAPVSQMIEVSSSSEDEGFKARELARRRKHGKIEERIQDRVKPEQNSSSSSPVETRHETKRSSFSELMGLRFSQ